MNNKEQILKLAKQIYIRDFLIKTSWSQALEDAKNILKAEGKYVDSNG